MLLLLFVEEAVVELGFVLELELAAAFVDEPLVCGFAVEFVSCLELPFVLLLLALLVVELFELVLDESTDVVEALTAAEAVATPANVAAAEAGGAFPVDVSVDVVRLAVLLLAFVLLALVLAEVAPAPMTPATAAFDDDDVVSFKWSLEADALLDDESTTPLLLPPPW